MRALAVLSILLLTACAQTPEDRAALLSAGTALILGSQPGYYAQPRMATTCVRQGAFLNCW